MYVELLDASVRVRAWLGRMLCAAGYLPSAQDFRGPDVIHTVQVHTPFVVRSIFADVGT